MGAPDPSEDPVMNEVPEEYKLVTRRDETKIIHDVLKLIATDNATLTAIRAKCNLNFDSATRTIERLLQDSLITYEINSERRVYRTTRQGLLFLEQLNKLLEMKTW
ncbi:MAG: winged helix-turn-helix domain-containing protein [Candidatus Thermoplasmatota archaeon]|nr:winged helix-turn-helix domain-containing protein [Candidatus Thermoplasmatota archaeon]